MDDTYLKVLQMIQDGIISAEEAEELLRALDHDDRPTPEPEPAGQSGPAPAAKPETTRSGPPDWWEGTWVYLLAAGVALTALAAAFTIPIAQGHSNPGWLACTLPLMAFGALLAGLTWCSRTAPWLHVLVREENQRISISLPVPLQVAAWALRLVRIWIPQLRGTAVDEVILSLADADGGGEDMLLVEVDDTDSGEQVEVRIG
jgi:hypothetical protein